MATFELQDELNAIQDLDSYNFEHERDFSTESPHDLLEGKANLNAFGSV